jgi:hypothetical protein
MNASVMVVVSVASLALALVMGIILAFILRHERRRSDARAAMLAEMAAESSAPFDSDFELETGFRPELEIAHAGSPDLFAAPPARSAWPRRLAIVGALAIVLVGTVTVVRSALSPAAPAAAAARSEEPALLDLLSLTHAQNTASLTITGLVQNPRTGQTMSKVVATAMLFGADDTFIASGKTSLDLTTLRPGDESGFVITVPLASAPSTAVTRYRVGFRGEDGRIIGHIDRRMSTAIARGPS